MGVMGVQILGTRIHEKMRGDFMKKLWVALGVLGIMLNQFPSAQAAKKYTNTEVQEVIDKFRDQIADGSCKGITTSAREIEKRILNLKGSSFDRRPIQDIQHELIDKFAKHFVSMRRICTEKKSKKIQEIENILRNLEQATGKDPGGALKRALILKEDAEKEMNKEPRQIAQEFIDEATLKKKHELENQLDSIQIPKGPVGGAGNAR